MAGAVGLLLAITRRNPFIEREQFKIDNLGDLLR